MRRELLALLLLAPGAGLAWELTGVTWSWQDHPIEDPFFLAADSFPADVDTGEVQDALVAAMDTWNGEERDLHLQAGGVSDGAELLVDGHWNLLWYDSSTEPGWSSTLAFAASWTWADGTGNDCDLVMLSANEAYGGAIPWSTDPDGPGSGQIDAQAVLLHELGHCVGLDHSADSGAVMYAWYQGLRSLSADDQAGLAALYGPSCIDGDGDGYSDCDADCDDADAAVFPGAGEVCNGLDDDCDGVVDHDDTLTLALATDGTQDSTSWVAAANVFRITAPTALRTVRQRLAAPAGARLVWLVADTTDARSWSLVRSEYGVATGEEWEESPRFDLPLEADGTYAIGVGVMGDHSAWLSRDKPEESGPLRTLGVVYGRALGDDLGMLDNDYVVAQELTVVDLADPDDDGWTGACGDCGPDDPLVHEGAAERCNDIDDDCDGEVDEDYAVDTDADGVIDCLDPCPDDPLDDRDGDGACDSADPCPDDPEDTCDDPEEPEDTGTAADPDGGAADGGAADGEATDAGAADGSESSAPKGGCSSAPSRAHLLGLLLLGLVPRRRRSTG